MPRKPILLSNTDPYHITARCNNKEKFHCDLQTIWDLFCEEISNISDLYEIKLHAFVLMPNHFHLLISTPQGNIGEVMQTFIAAITRQINLKSGRSGRVFGARYHGSLVSTDHYYDCVLKYVYRNPVKAMITELVEDYPFSTLQTLLGLTNFSVPIVPPLGHLHNIPDEKPIPFLKWINQPFKSEQYEVIRNAVHKTVFQPKNKGWKQKEFKLDSFKSFLH